MIGIMKAENMKMRHTVSRLLIWLVPIIVVACAYLLSRNYLYSMAVNWWYAGFFYIIVGLLVALANQKEQKKLQYFNIYQQPLPLHSIWIAKVSALVIDIIVMENLLGVFVCMISMFANGTIENGILVTMLAFNLIWILNIWQVPVYLFLAFKFGFYAPIPLCAFFMIGGVAYSLKPMWWMNPVAWTDRIMCTVVHYLPNGIQMSAEDYYLCSSYQTIAGIILTAVIMFVVFTFATAVIFERGQKKC